MKSTPYHFEPHYCPHCKTLVPVKELNILGVVKYVQPVCKCEAEAEERRLQEMNDRQREREIESKFSISSLGERFTECTFEAFKPREGTAEAFGIAKQYAETFNRRNPDSLLIWGDPGNGKSHMAAAIAHRLKQNGHIVVFQTVPDLLARIRNTFNRSNAETEQSVIAALTDCHLLIMDDIGAERVTDWVQDTLFQVIDGRYRQKRPILYTSNFKPSDLKERVGARIYDRMIETSIILENKATSFRMQKAVERFKSMQEGK